MGSLFNNPEDDLPLRPRGAVEARTSQDQNTGRARGGADREFTLSTGTVLAIFFALAVLCAVFFGFGYSMGKKSGQAAVAASRPGADAPDALPSGSGDPKPSPATSVQSVPGYQGAVPTVSAERPRTDADARTAGNAEEQSPGKPAPRQALEVTSPPVAANAGSAEDTRAALPKPAPVVRVPPAAAPVPPSASAPLPPVSPTGTIFVQIVAVSHQEDANVVMAALRRRGYSVVQRSTNGDPLIHVQVGPFANKKDAEAMRQRLGGDGYNAILK